MLMPSTAAFRAANTGVAEIQNGSAHPERNPLGSAHLERNPPGSPSKRFATNTPSPTPCGLSTPFKAICAGEPTKYEPDPNPKNENQR
ncbi:hypothetical protein M0R45_034254 [Rubus argutus]|uniref:Uncharacterized protein n=1 Tax=Rubus argutus TaxID=59490 RepID=A0AAW1VT95_RUBAR